MAKQFPEEALSAIEEVLARLPDGAAAPEILRSLDAEIPLRTLQHRLKYLVTHHRIVIEGQGRWVKYRLADTGNTPVESDNHTGERAPDLPLSDSGKLIREYVQQALQARKPVGYERSFLDQYRPNISYYLSDEERAHLILVGRPKIAPQPAGTYARQILNRLLIDLAWNSSRLEGNTYSLLDTRRLIEFGEVAEGRENIEAQMILNHKDAIEFLVSAPQDIGFNKYTLLNLHALLANNLLPDPTAVGRLRYIAVGIERSTFHPLEVPQLVEECFAQILATAGAIIDPFEQAFFVMVQLPYLQPFDDVNKRVSRLAANIPLIKGNLSPLSFADVPRQAYTEAVLGVYELNKIELLKDIFIWAYERSAARYTAVRQSLGEPDPFRLRYRAQLLEIISRVMRSEANRKVAVTLISEWAAEHIDAQDRQQFIQTAEAELSALHEGNFARYQVRPSEFAAWREVWQSE